MPETGVAAFLREREALVASAIPEADAARRLSELTDSAVSALAEAALSRLSRPWALLALGGWGARRLLPLSDLDLLVVTDAAASELKPAISEVLYPLWDAGLKVGHQVRTRRDHERAARDDVQTLTATLTGRALCGDAALSARVLTEVAAGARKRTARVVAELTQRPRPGSPYLLEPDLKEGAGGQRDLDELTWLAAVLTGVPASSPAGLVDAGLLDGREAAAPRRRGPRDRRGTLGRACPGRTGFVGDDSRVGCGQWPAPRRRPRRYRRRPPPAAQRARATRARTHVLRRRHGAGVGNARTLGAEDLFALFDRRRRRAASAGGGGMERCARRSRPSHRRADARAAPGPVAPLHCGSAPVALRRLCRRRVSRTAGTPRRARVRGGPPGPPDRRASARCRQGPVRDRPRRAGRAGGPHARLAVRAG